MANVEAYTYSATAVRYSMDRNPWRDTQADRNRERERERKAKLKPKTK